ncbi:MAG: hypothetical protein GEU75_01340 [Dehalococcoidia bacterium]|nr:hypothetical protein [Dehalococcoidia bacterium]
MVSTIVASARARPLLLGAVSIFLLLSTVYTLSVGLRATNGSSITGDEPFYLVTTQSLLQDGDLDLGNQYERESWRSFFDHPAGLWKQMVPAADGRLVSPHDPGLSVLLMPGFALDGLRGAQAQLLLLAALTMSLAYVLAARETGLPLLSWLAAATIGLSATAFVYSTEVYPEFPAALCLVLGLLLVRGRPGNLLDGLLLATLLSALAWLGIKYVSLGAIIGVYFLSRASMEGRGGFLALAAVSGATYVWAHYAIFGDLTPYSINTVYEGAPAVDVLQSHISIEDRAYRVWGLFIDRRFGIGRWAPLLLFILPALPLLLARGRLGWAVAALIGAQVLIATFVAITMMGWWFPGRTLLAVLPLFVLVIVALIEALPRLLRAGMALLGVYSLAVTGALILASRSQEIRLAVDPFDMNATVFQITAPLFPQYTAWGLETVLLTIAWLTIGIATLFGLTLRAHGEALTALAARPRHAQPGTRSGIVARHAPARGEGP